MNRSIFTTIVSLALLAWAQGARGADRGAPPGCCGDTGITQNNDLLDTGTLIVLCDTNASVETIENAWARCFDGADFPSDFTLQCVEFGVEKNGFIGGIPGPNFDVDLRISTLSAGCPPAGITFGDPSAGQTWYDAPAGFNVLHTQTVTILNNSSGLLQFVLVPAVVIPAGADVLFELHAPTRDPGEGGDNGIFHLGGNTSGATGETFIWTPQCGFTSYAAIADIDPTFTMQWVVRLNGTFGPVAPPVVDCNANGVPDECEIDCNGNGIPDACEGADDVALFIGQAVAAVPDPFLTCMFDYNGDGIVDGLDVQPFVNNLLIGL